MALFKQDRDGRLRGRTDAACGAGNENGFLRHDFLLYFTSKTNIAVSKSSETTARNEPAVASVRLAFRTKLDKSEILDAYWRLEDRLHRIVDLVSDSPEAADQLQSAHPRLVRDVVGLLEVSTRLRFSRIPAVDLCCETINSYLIELEQSKQNYRVKAASS